MAHALVFHSAADGEDVRAMLVGSKSGEKVAVAGPVPAGVRFGHRVVVVWSRHAAADYAASAPALPRNAVVLRLDDTPLPESLADAAALRVHGDGADASRLDAALSSIVPQTAARAPLRAASGVRPSLQRPQRPLPVAPRAAEAASPARAKAAVRRQAQSASVVVSAGAFGTLTAVALGAVFPAESIVTPSFAANPTNESTTMDVRQHHLAQSHAMAVDAAFDRVMTPAGVSVTFSADEMQALTQRLEQSDQDLTAARAWSDGLINRLQSLSSRAPDAMPAMGAVPRGPATAAAPAAAEAPALASGETEIAPLALRERFSQVEPVVYAVDRMADVVSAAPTTADRSGA